MVGGLFRKKPKRDVGSVVPRFSVELLPAVIAPSEGEYEIARKQIMIKVLWVVLLVMTATSVLAGYSLQAIARVEPYVVDGGVFGCPVPILIAAEL